MESHLLQMRGLKLSKEEAGSGYDPVVASFTDAWIETLTRKLSRVVLMSHLLQMRGLKLLELVDAKSAPVASFTDAWIETR